MKRTWNKNSVIILFIVSILSFPVFAVEQKEDLAETEHVISELEHLDLVRNVRERWGNTSTITRKDALTMAYLATNTWWELYFPSRRFYNIFTSDGAHTTFSYNFDYKGEMEAASEQAGINFCFSDVKPEDEKLVYSLMMSRLLAGKITNGQTYAGLYDMITNEEALVTLIRMLDYRNCTTSSITAPWQPQENENVYDKGVDLGIIRKDIAYRKQETEVVRPVYLSRERLNEPIKVFDYFKMYYRALGIDIRLGNGYGMDWTGNYLSIIRNEIQKREPNIAIEEDIIS